MGTKRRWSIWLRRHSFRLRMGSIFVGVIFLIATSLFYKGGLIVSAPAFMLAALIVGVGRNQPLSFVVYRLMRRDGDGELEAHWEFKPGLAERQYRTYISHGLSDFQAYDWMAYEVAFERDIELRSVPTSHKINFSSFVAAGITRSEFDCLFRAGVVTPEAQRAALDNGVDAELLAATFR